MIETRRTGSLPATVLRDTRERRPWTFDDAPVETRDVTLSTADYAVPAHCTHDPETDTYHPQFGVERKSGHDFLDAVTWERDRFEAELRRATGWPRPLQVVVETSWERLLRGRGCMNWRDSHPNQIVGTVSAWTRHHNVNVRFADNRGRAERLALLLLVRHDLVRRRERR